MGKFIDRENEMAFLEEQYAREEASLAVVYGRRRVGKTTLLTEFCKDKPSLYFLATEESIQENRNAFRLAVAEWTGNSLLLSGNQFTWEVLFEQLANSVGRERLVIVLDEFQYLGKANKGYPSVLSRIWDAGLKEKNVMLILCGSLISMMEEQTLSYTSPLYGRRTGQLKLKQVPFKYYKDFFTGGPALSQRELLYYFAVTGGVPKYVELFQPYGDIYNAIDRNILQRGSFLYEEPRFLLQNEVREVGTYFSIIKTIASGRRKLGEIASALEVVESSLTSPLQTLMDLDIVEREVPVTQEKPEVSKSGLYRIKDNFLAFWFRFIYPYQSFVESGHPDLVLEKIRKSLVVNHTAFVYEDICRDHIWELSATNQLPALYNKVGRWWGKKGAEIDIVGLDTVSQQEILFGECKFRETKPVDADVLLSLIQKAQGVHWGTADRREHFVLFTTEQAGYTESTKELAKSRGDVTLLTLT